MVEEAKKEEVKEEKKEDESATLRISPGFFKNLFQGPVPALVLGFLGVGSFGYSASAVKSQLDATAASVNANIQKLTDKVDTRFEGIESSLTALKQDVAIFKSQDSGNRVSKLEMEFERLKALVEEQRRLFDEDRRSRNR